MKPATAFAVRALHNTWVLRKEHVLNTYLHHLYYLRSVASFASSSSRTALRCAASVLETRTPAAPWENCDHKLWPPWIQNNLISQDISRSSSCEVLVLQHHFNPKISGRPCSHSSFVLTIGVSWHYGERDQMMGCFGTSNHAYSLSTWSFCLPLFTTCVS